MTCIPKKLRRWLGVELRVWLKVAVLCVVSGCVLAAMWLGFIASLNQLFERIGWAQ